MMDRVVVSVGGGSGYNADEDELSTEEGTRLMDQGC